MDNMEENRKKLRRENEEDSEREREGSRHMKGEPKKHIQREWGWGGGGINGRGPWSGGEPGCPLAPLVLEIAVRSGQINSKRS